MIVGGFVGGSAVWFATSSVVIAASSVLAKTDESFKNIADGISSIVTALAVIIGGVWAYFKFVRGRTYRPRLSVDMVGQWRKLDDATPGRRVVVQRTIRRPIADSRSDVFHARIRVTNIGASKVSLKQYGTGLKISFPAKEQPEPPDDVQWEYVPLRKGEDQFRVFEILEEHAWIEPGETVSDDLLLNLDRSPAIARLELSLIWGLSRRRYRWRLYRRIFGDPDGFSRKDIEVFARRIIPPDMAML
jgi:hypothetical protein